VGGRAGGTATRDRDGAGRGHADRGVGAADLLPQRASDRDPPEAIETTDGVGTVALEFEPGRRYDEKEVNATVARYFTDHAALRRTLVDEGFLDRDHGEYRRAGGAVDPSEGDR
jgi:hypothetical protein